MLSGGWGAKFEGAISHRFPLDRANEALTHVREWRGAKTVLIP